MEKSGYTPARSPATGASRRDAGDREDGERGTGRVDSKTASEGLPLVNAAPFSVQSGVFAAALTSSRPLRVFPLSTRTKERAEGMDTAGALEDKASTVHFPVRKRSRMASKQRRWRGVISFHARCSSPRTADSSSIIRWRLSRGTDSPRSIRARQVEHFAETEPYQSSASSHTRCWADAKMDPQKSRRTARYRFKPNTVQR